MALWYHHSYSENLGTYFVVFALENVAKGLRSYLSPFESVAEKRHHLYRDKYSRDSYTESHAKHAKPRRSACATEDPTLLFPILTVTHRRLRDALTLTGTGLEPRSRLHPRQPHPLLHLHDPSHNDHHRRAHEARPSVDDHLLVSPVRDVEAEVEGGSGTVRLASGPKCGRHRRREDVADAARGEEPAEERGGEVGVVCEGGS